MSSALGLWRGGGLSFTRSFLNTRKHLPLFDRIFKGFILFSVVLGLSFIFLPYQIATQAMVLIIGLSVLIMITCSLLLLFKSIRQARFYLLAWTPFIASAILIGFKSFGFMENNWVTDSMVQNSAIFVAILLSLGLMDKIHAFRQERGKVLDKLHTSEAQYRMLAEKKKEALEFQLHQSGKLEAIGTLAGSIAHDMNNIVVAIMGYAELSLYKAKKRSRLHHRLDRIIQACHRARDLVGQILTFSRQDNQEC